MLWLLSGQWGLPVGFLLLQYSVLFTVFFALSLFYILIYMFYEMMH